MFDISLSNKLKKKIKRSKTKQKRYNYNTLRNTSRETPSIIPSFTEISSLNSKISQLHSTVSELQESLHKKTSQVLSLQSEVSYLRSQLALRPHPQPIPQFDKLRLISETESLLNERNMKIHNKDI